MTVHRKQNPKRRKSKIILLQKPYTTLLQKKRKNTKIIKKSDKTKTDIYKKNRLNTLSNPLKIKNILAIQYKVHSTYKCTFNKV